MNVTMGFLDWYWPIWLVIGFGVPELVALRNGVPGDTLSEKVRRWFGTEATPRGRFVKARRVTLLASLAWLVVHWLTTGGFM